MSSAAIKHGFPATGETGCDVKDLGARDQRVADSAFAAPNLASLKRGGIDAVARCEARVGPTYGSLLEVIEFAKDGCFGGLVGIGGAPSMDASNAANLNTTWPPEVLKKSLPERRRLRSVGTVANRCKVSGLAAHRLSGTTQPLRRPRAILYPGNGTGDSSVRPGTRELA